MPHILERNISRNKRIRRNKVTIKDVAKVLHVSPATVSKALRGARDISATTQAEVKRVSEKLGYRPNLLAQSLVNRRSNLIGAVIPDLRISFFSEAARGIYEQAEKRGYEVILVAHDESEISEKRKLEFLSDIRVDGILLNPAAGKANYGLFENLRHEGIQIVCWDRKIEDLDLRSVTVDDEKAAFELTSEIVKEGRKRILFLGPISGISVATDRYKGYLSALKKHGIPFERRLVVESTLHFEDSHRKMHAALAGNSRIDGVVCVGGEVAFGAGTAILEARYSIPDDIILGEFGDNSSIARLGVPYYSVFQNPYEIGKSALNLLVKCINGQGTRGRSENVIVNTKIVHHEMGNRWNILD